MRTTLPIILIFLLNFLLSVSPSEAADSSLTGNSVSNDTSVVSLPGIVLGEVAVTTIKGGYHANADEAVTYIGAKSVEDYDLVNIKQAAALAPNFYIPAYGSRMTSSIYVRGLGTRIDQPAVGLNIDNIPIINKDNFDFDIADIDRIEMLRGPQNILYGRNTMGGLINIYTVSPLNYQGVRAKVRYGNHDTYQASAGVYGKLSDVLGMSLAGEVSGTDGFYTNDHNGMPVGRERLGSIRWKTVYRPTSRVVVENTAMLTRARQNGYPYAQASTKHIDYNDTCYYKRFSFIDGLTVKHSFRGITFSSILSTQYLNDDMMLDQDFSSADYFTLRQKRKEWAFTGDFVARGPQSGHYRWLTGLFGFYRRSKMEAPVNFLSTGIERLIVARRNSINPHYPIAWDSSSFTLGSDFIMPSGGISVYHESALQLGNFTITAGLRFDWERTNLEYHSLCNTAYTTYDNNTQPAPEKLPVYMHNTVEIDDHGSLSKDYTQLLPKLSVSYQLPGSTGNIFISATKGYKAGGYNTQMFSDFLQQSMMAQMGLQAQYNVEQTVAYKPETDWNFEAGAHLSLLDHRLSADMSLFWILIEEQQVTMFPEGSITGRIMTNAGRSRSRGVELSLSWADRSGWFARASYGFTDARFTRFNNGRADYSGKRMPYAPSNTLFVGAGYSHKLKGFINHIEAEINTRGTGSIQWDEANTVSQPFYMLLNASIKLSHRHIGLELWANNITATQYDTFYFVSIGNAFLQHGNGFSIGATASYRFDFP